MLHSLFNLGGAPPLLLPHSEKKTSFKLFNHKNQILHSFRFVFLYSYTYRLSEMFTWSCLSEMLGIMGFHFRAPLQIHQHNNAVMFERFHGAPPSCLETQVCRSAVKLLAVSLHSGLTLHR